jgi:hypothetical protein
VVAPSSSQGGSGEVPVTKKSTDSLTLLKNPQMACEGSPGKFETNDQLDYHETRKGVEPGANFAQDLQASLGAYETASD